MRNFDTINIIMYQTKVNNQTIKRAYLNFNVVQLSEHYIQWYNRDTFKDLKNKTRFDSEWSDCRKLIFLGSDYTSAHVIGKVLRDFGFFYFMKAFGKHFLKLESISSRKHDLTPRSSTGLWLRPHIWYQIR